MAFAKKPPEERIGHSHGSFADNGPVTRGRSKRDQLTVLPTASPRWLPTTVVWYESLALSGQSAFYEASDYATAICAAEALDLAIRSRNGGLMNQFTRLSERLAVTLIDRKRARLDLAEPEPTDKDDEAATEAVQEWHRKLHLVPDPD